jgi:hypothetical protein
MQARAVTAAVHSSATADEIWRLLGTAGYWPTWAHVRSASLERHGASAPEGVGALRAFRTPLGTTREEVVIYEVGRRLGYALVSGLPVREYRGVVALSPEADGTTITWSASFRSTWLWHLLVRWIIRSSARRLAAAAARSRARSAAALADLEL